MRMTERLKGICPELLDIQTELSRYGFHVIWDGDFYVKNIQGSNVFKAATLQDVTAWLYAQKSIMEGY